MGAGWGWAVGRGCPDDKHGRPPTSMVAPPGRSPVIDGQAPACCCGHPPGGVRPDDAMAILLAFSSPEVRVVAITTIYGNVPTELATQNALRLVEMAGEASGV